MNRVTAEQRINDALRRKLPPSRKYLRKPASKVRSCREKSRTWDGPFTVTSVVRKFVAVTEGRTAKTFIIAQVLLHQRIVNDVQAQRQLQRPVEHKMNSAKVIRSSEPRYRSQRSKDAI